MNQGEKGMGKEGERRGGEGKRRGEEGERRGEGGERGEEKERRGRGGGEKGKEIVKSGLQYSAKSSQTQATWKPMVTEMLLLKPLLLLTPPPPTPIFPGRRQLRWLIYLFLLSCDSVFLSRCLN